MTIMGKVFDLPVKIPKNDDFNKECIVADSFYDASDDEESYGDIYFQGGSIEENKMTVIAINNHDDMYAMLEKVKQGYLNLCEFDIIPDRYQNDASETIEEINQLLLKARGEQ